MEISLIDKLPQRPSCIMLLPTSVVESAHLARDFSIPSLSDSAFSEDGAIDARLYINSVGQNVIVSPQIKDDHEGLRSALDRAMQIVLSSKFTELVLIAEKRDSRYLLTVIARSVFDNCYIFDKYKSKGRRVIALKELKIYTGRVNTPVDHGLLQDQIVINQCVDYARDLANTPPNICNPEWLATSVLRLGRESNSLNVESLDDVALRSERMNAMLAVASGSDNSARLLLITHKGMSSNRRPIVLIGKGVTFDTGGISLKPPAKMDEMKYDMCGAAAVIATMKILDMLQVKLNVIAIVPCVENMPSGTAYRPGDIITTKLGKSVEVLNTDAEGRLILADSITFAERYNPMQIIDVATLTGACVVALGRHLSAMYSNNDQLAESLLSAGKSSLDSIWRMPLGTAYHRQLKSNFADLANIGGPEAGSVTAACFLESFVPEKTPWAHLDVAGTAWVSGDKKGATGRPTALLAQYLLELSRA